MQIALYKKVYDLRIFQVKLDGVKREIIKNVENSSKKRPAARLEFLQKLFAQPTFGSTFITCTNTADKGLPERILVAINKKGVSVVDPVSKQG